MTYRMASSGGGNSASAPSGTCSSVLHHHRMRSAQVRAGSGLRIAEGSESPDSDFELVATKSHPERSEGGMPRRIPPPENHLLSQHRLQVELRLHHGDTEVTETHGGRQELCGCAVHPQLFSVSLRALRVSVVKPIHTANRSPPRDHGSPPAGGAVLRPSDPLGDVARHRRRFDPTARQPDMPVRTQQVERRPRDLRAVELAVIGGIPGTSRVRSRSPSPGTPPGGAGCPITRRVNRVSSNLGEQVLGGTVRGEREPQPRKAIARTRRAGGQARQRFRERAVRVGNAGLGDRAKGELRTRSSRIASARIFGAKRVRNSPARPLSDTMSENARSVVLAAVEPPGCARSRRSRAASRAQIPRSPAPASSPGCRHPAGRCSCPARRPGCGCAPRRPAGSTGGHGTARRGDGGCGRSRTSCSPEETTPSSRLLDGSTESASSSVRSSRPRMAGGTMPTTRQ